MLVYRPPRNHLLRKAFGSDVKCCSVAVYRNLSQQAFQLGMSPGSSLTRSSQIQLAPHQYGNMLTQRNPMVEFLLDFHKLRDRKELEALHATCRTGNEHEAWKISILMEAIKNWEFKFHWSY